MPATLLSARVFLCLLLALMVFALNSGAAEFEVSRFGARPDGAVNNTAAIQQAIDAAAAAGGGEVTFRKGTYMSGAVFLKSNVRLRLDEGVELRAIQDDRLYPERPTRVAGIEMTWPSGLLNVYQQTNVAITGKGTIDGNGQYWWRKFWGEDGKGGMLKDYRARGLRWAVDYDCKRVRALVVYDSRDVQVRDLTIKRSGFWSLTLIYSQRVTVDGVVVRANIGGYGPSSDGVDIDSSRDIVVQNCDIDCNDDDICLKAGRDADGLRVNRPTENITIRNCVTRSGHGMLTLGSETSGGIRNVFASGLRAYGTATGIRFKSARVRGGVVENVVLSDITLENVANPLDVELNWYPSYSYPKMPPELDGRPAPAHWTALTRPIEPPERGIPEVRNIVISNLTATGAEQAISVGAYPEKPIRQVRLEKVRIEAQKAGSITHAADWTLEHVVLATPAGQNVQVRNSSNVPLPQVERIVSVSRASPEPVVQGKPLMLGLDKQAPGTEGPSDRPTLFLIGDSTVKNGTKGLQGWGEVLARYCDTNQVRVVNRALGGRSSRTFLTEGLWQKVLAELKPGDFVLMQFGHNDNGPLDTGRARASLKGVGEEERTITNQVSKKVEIVHSYGWYLRRYISDTKARGATPIVLSLVPRNIWKDDHVLRATHDYAQWAAEAAKAGGAQFIDLNALVADRYDKLGPELVAKFFPGDHTHTNPDGAALNAQTVARALAGTDCGLQLLVNRNALPHE